ncbi:hypothetical protein [Phenylobacterium sp.]|uniref:fimbrial biogenesis chaperone n=1 Tax=Phenylobacterium sp. TaxID=1871053 RepID=UPI002F93958D
MSRISLSVAIAALAVLAAPQAPAQPAAPATPAVTANVTTVGANLNISPKRVTFDRNRRSATVYIYNQGNAAATFDVSLVDRAMLPDGQIVALSDAESRPEAKPYAEQVKSASSMLLVSPRRVTLAPGQGQTIRLRANPQDSAAAEYRSHLTITTIPPRDAGLTAEAAAGVGPNELRFQINSVFGLSIPAIIRTGDADVRAGIENVRLEYAEVTPQGQTTPRRTAVAVFDIVRLGTNSLFGNIEIRPTGAKNSEVIGLARGVGVYPEVGRRTLRIPLNRPLAAGEKLEVTFTDDDTSPGKLLAKQAS